MRARLGALLLTGLAVSAPPATADRLKVEGIAGGEQVVVMINARTKPGAGGCTLTVLRSSGETSHDNLLAGCKPWIAVLSAGNAMLLETPVNKWTNGAEDVHTVTLRRLIDVPVRVWIANPKAEDDARDDMAYANLVFELNKVGIQFVPRYKTVPPESAGVIEDAIAPPDDEGQFKCRNLRALQRSAFYVGNTLNVYYVKRRALTGRNCAITRPKGDGNINFIGPIANRAVLAHELGHAFGLRPMDAGGHPDEDQEGFTANNVMSGNGNGERKRFTAGQVFRMNTHVDAFGGTMLIRNGLRQGPKRKCPPLMTTEECPALNANPERGPL